MASGRVIVPLRGGSDGDASHRPDNPAFQLSPLDNYLEKLGTLWMKDRKESLPGVSYHLERLPTGYAVFGRPRPSDPKHIDHYCFGHPRHRTFDSPNRFYPHFKHLMENGGSNFGCPCIACTGSVKANTNSSPASTMKNGASTTTATSTAATSKVPQPRIAFPPLMKGRPKTKPPGTDTTTSVDEEGTPDVYRQFIDKLKRERTVDERIAEPLSLDWRAEQECLPRLKSDLKKTAPFQPRVGELVLFIRDLPKHISLCRDPKSHDLQLYDEEQQAFLGYPRWQAGVITQIPADQIDIKIDDLVQDDRHTWNVTHTGVRVECLPNINSKDKSLSKRYCYVPLHQVRPLIFYRECLGNIPEDEWHPTVLNALTALSTVSLVNTFRFRGTWPNAWIYAYAIYIGAELFSISDAVRLMPTEANQPCTRVLVISSIRLRLTNLDVASDNDYDERRPYNSEIFLFGKGYTTEQERSSKEWYSVDDDLPEVLTEYGAEHPLHPPGKEIMVPFSRVLGRLYDSDAMMLWLPPLSDSNSDGPEISSAIALDAGREAILQARMYGRTNDHRITTSAAEGGPSNWFWASSRAEALDLVTVNGLEVSKHDKDRDIKNMRKAAKILADEENEERNNNGAPQVRDGLRGFMAEPAEQSRARASGRGRLGAVNTLANPIDISSTDDDELEFRRHTRIIDETVDLRRSNTPKVAVVIASPKKPKRTRSFGFGTPGVKNDQAL